MILTLLSAADTHKIQLFSLRTGDQISSSIPITRHRYSNRISCLWFEDYSYQSNVFASNSAYADTGAGVVFDAEDALRSSPSQTLGIPRLLVCSGDRVDEWCW